MDLQEARQRHEEARAIASTAGRRLTAERDACDERLRGAIREAFAGRHAAKECGVGLKPTLTVRAIIRDA
jgi:hypothetical protein